MKITILESLFSINGYKWINIHLPKWIFCMIRPTFLSPPLQSDEKSPGLRGWAYWAPPAHHAWPWDGHFSSSQHIPTLDVEHEEQNKAMKTPISSGISVF